METAVLAALLGVGLSIASGLRAFLPLLLAALAARFGWFGLDFGQQFAWLHSDLALWALGLATVVEIAADKIPAVDHALDAVGFLVRPGAAALGAMAVFSDADPALYPLIALIAVPTALGTQTIKAGARAVSTPATAGVGNPILSVGEDVAATVATLLSLLAPVLVPLLLIAAAIGGWSLWRLIRKLRRPVNSGVAPRAGPG